MGPWDDPGPFETAWWLLLKNERQIIDAHKTEYLMLTSPASRKAYVQMKILSPFLDFWADRGQPVPSEKKDERNNVTF